MNRSPAYRRHQRYVHGMRRIKQDRMEHGSPYYNRYRDGVITTEISCECFAPEADQGRGRIFSFFADTPHRERDPWQRWEPDPRERRAPKASEWEEDASFVPTRALGWYQ